MMTNLTARGQLLAREAQRRQVRNVADRLRRHFGEGSVEAGEAQVLVRGRGLIKRWLIDPGLRFLSGDMR